MEEAVGKIWHKMISKASDNHYPDQAVLLSSMMERLSIQFHALGGAQGIQILPAQRSLWDATPSLLYRVANIGEKVELASSDEQSIRLPSEIALFPSVELNRSLYLWLLLLLSRRDSGQTHQQSHWIVENQKLVLEVLEAFPGSQKLYRKLLDAHLIYRKNCSKVRSKLADDEIKLQQALLDPGSVNCEIIEPRQLPPVPLWLHPYIPEIAIQKRSDKGMEVAENNKQAKLKLKQKHRRKGEIVDDPDGRSGLLSFRLESMFSWSEFINVDRTADDSEDEQAQQAADDMDVISISQSQETIASSIKFDLDLPSESFDDKVLLDGILLPEWNYKKQQLIPDYCSLKVMVSKESQPCKAPKHLQTQIRNLRAQFDYLKPEKHWLKNQLDGSELDIDNVIRYQTDLESGKMGKMPGLYKSLQHDMRDLSCLLLADLSLSTDAYINNDSQVIDVIRDSLFLFSEALDATGDSYAISGFSSVKNSQIRYHQIKRFNEKLTDNVRGYIKAIKPGYYTRIGAAIRYASRQLVKQQTSQKLLLLLTDGKPNDIDQYEGRYGIEDTRQSLIEARKMGLQTFCITIDEDANQYLPYLFGQDNYILVRRAEDLPKKLLNLYIRLTN